MMSAASALSTAALAIAVTMFVTWLISLVKKNASIVDIVWGLGYVIVAWVVHLRLHHATDRSTLLVVIVTLWGLRLASYLFWRNHGKGEDYRYVAMRRHWGARFPLVSLFTVFGLQGVLMWVVSLGVQLGQADDSSLGALAWVGTAVWAIGLTIEAVGDLQLARFKSDPANAGKVMDRGLWRYTRHPNYFGDACAWWGIALVASESGVGAWGLLGAAVMTGLLLRVSGVALLEKSLRKRKPDYEAYVARTSAFIPLPPKRG
jgi:steroid 5-alpha reductase family enzyme